MPGNFFENPGREIPDFFKSGDAPENTPASPVRDGRRALPAGQRKSQTAPMPEHAEGNHFVHSVQTGRPNQIRKTLHVAELHMRVQEQHIPRRLLLLLAMPPRRIQGVYQMAIPEKHRAG